MERAFDWSAARMTILMLLKRRDGGDSNKNMV
jgi:hypothetical protein